MMLLRNRMWSASVLATVLFAALPLTLPAQAAPRARARDLGVAPGVFEPGPRNAITDVAGVRVGQTTLIEGDSVRTGVTAILPHGGNLFLDRVPAAIFVGNGFGKLLGSTQVNELGELETPILLTCTLCVWRAADALVGWMLEQPGMERVRSINPVVGETNDGLAERHPRAARSDEERSAPRSRRRDTGRGRGGKRRRRHGHGRLRLEGRHRHVVARAAGELGGWTVGVLVQTNFGGVLQMMGAPVGRGSGRLASPRRLIDAEGRRLDHHRRRDRRARLRPQPRAARRARAVGPRAHRLDRVERLGRLRHRVLDRGRRSARPLRPAARLTRTSWATTTCRPSSRRWSRRPKKRSTIRCSWPPRSIRAALPWRRSRSIACATCSGSTGSASADAEPHAAARLKLIGAAVLFSTGGAAIKAADSPAGRSPASARASPPSRSG